MANRQNGHLCGIRVIFVYFLIAKGVDIKEVQELVERHLQDMILKYFDPKKADSIFTDEGEVNNITGGKNETSLFKFWK